METLDLLEQLLSITEQFKPQMTDDELRQWSEISARTADVRLNQEHNPESCGCEYRGNNMWSCGHCDNDV